MGNQILLLARNGLFGDDGSAGFWVGAAHRTLMSPFPSCWDELIDWTEESTVILERYLHGMESGERTAGQDNTNKQVLGTEVVLCPYVLNSAGEQVSEMSSMTPLERVQFCSENVVVAVMSPGQPPGILTVHKFLDLFRLLSRYLDMFATLQSKSPSRKAEECLICLNKDPKLIVLSCSHSICTKCHKRWVSRRLSCPFCRHKFQEESVHNQWELLEWQKKDVTEDMLKLEAKLSAFLHEIDFTSAELLESYELKERTLAVQEQDGIVTVEM